MNPIYPTISIHAQINQTINLVHPTPSWRRSALHRTKSFLSPKSSSVKPQTVGKKSQRFLKNMNQNEDNYSPRSSIVYINEGVEDDSSKHEKGVEDLRNYKGFHKFNNFSNIPPLSNPIKPKFKKKSSLLGKLIYNRKDSDDNGERRKSSGSKDKIEKIPSHTNLTGDNLKSGDNSSPGSSGNNSNSNSNINSRSNSNSGPSLQPPNGHNPSVHLEDSNHKFKFRLSSLTDHEGNLFKSSAHSSPTQRKNSYSSTIGSQSSPEKSRNNSKATSATMLDLNLTELDDFIKNPKQSMSSQSSNPWKAPDSWDVKVDIQDEDGLIHHNDSEIIIHTDDDITKLENFLSTKSDLPVLYGARHQSHIVTSQNDNKLKGKNHIIRIFKEDNTFTTILNSLEATTAEILLNIQKKFFLESISNYQLSLYIGNYVKVLEPFEKPLKIQMGLLMLSGYRDIDNLRMIGSEDLSFICKFVVESSHLRNLTHEEELLLSKDYVNVNLSGLNLKTIPIIFHQHTYEIETLNAGDNPAIYIPLDFIQSCSYLKSLTFSRNGCSKFPLNFLEATTLKYLDMEKNFLDELPSNFDSLNNLKHLKLNSNQLNSLPSSFVNLKNLETLNLSSNYFNSYPDPISELVNLKDLDLSYNDLQFLPKSIKNLKKLAKLNLCTNKLSKKLPDFFNELSSLKRLDIRYNYITNVDVLGSLPNLEAVYASKNYISGFFDKMESFRVLQFDRNPITNLEFKNNLIKLTSLNLSKAKLTIIQPEFITKIVHLEKLILDKNHLVNLPENLGSLTKLIHLSIFGNNLQVLPSSIGQLTNLQYLDLHSNNLQILPQEIWLLKSLTMLNVSSNMLTGFPTPPVSVAKRISSSANFNDLNRFQDIKEDSVMEDTIMNNNKSTDSLTDNLTHLLLADNRLNDECFQSLSSLANLMVLNLSYNDIIEIPNGGLSRLRRLHEIYLAGNDLSSLPADDFEALTRLKTLFVNNNKLVSLPAELSKLVNLQNLDVGSNQLKYNISNWPYDWSWHWNEKLRYLNFSGNKRFEIKQSHIKNPDTGEDFDSLLVLKNLKVLGLIDVTLTTSAVPDQNPEMRIRTTASELDDIGYGVSDSMGIREYVSSRDIFIQKFRGNENEVLFASFDGKGGSLNRGHKISAICKSLFARLFTEELNKIKEDSQIPDALRRTFLQINKEINGILASKKANSFIANTPLKIEFQDLNLFDDGNAGCSIAVIYIKDKKLYTANVGDTEALLSRKNGDHVLLTTKHDPTNRNEFERIRAAGGYVGGDGTLDGDLLISRGAGFFNYLPHTHSGPDVTSLEITTSDDMIIVASKVLWDFIQYEVAVDIIRQEKDDPMLASQKLRDFAISYGATDKISVMVISLGVDRNKNNGLYNSLSGKDNDLFGNVNQLIKKRRDRVGTGDTTLRMLDNEIEPPVGDLALVFTDIKNSTLLWDAYPVAMRSAIKIHNSIMRRQLRIVGGYEVKTEGDSFMVSFPTPTSALLWCFNVQQQLLTADWPVEILETDQCFEVTDNNGNTIYRGLSVRMGIHWGSPVCELDVITHRMDYFGPMVNRASRINALADGGQICISSDFYNEIQTLFNLIDKVNDKETTMDEAFNGNLMAGEIIEQEIKQLKETGCHYYELGEKKLKGLEAPEHITLAYPEKLIIRFEIFKNQSSSNTVTSNTIFGALPIDAIYGLRSMSLKLERICCSISGAVFQNDFQENSSQQLLNKSAGLFKDSELLGLLYHVVVRIENCVSIIALRQNLSSFKGNNNFEHNVPTLKVIDELNQIIKDFSSLTTKHNLPVN